MPHSRSRYAQKLIEKALTHSPIVGVLGHRQVGKTTLTSSLSNEYVTFDSAPRLAEATSHPSEFLENRKSPFTIDEAQLCPPLFPATKEWVRLHPKKGQFIFTGSVRFTSRKLIRESLTGRIINVEILPMTLSELSGLPLPSQLSQLLKINQPSQLQELSELCRKKRPQTFLNYLDTGGLPGICFFRDESVRHDRFESHLDTVLNRDLRLIVATTLSTLQLRKLAIYLAENQGLPFELKAASHACQAATPTIKKLLMAFESLFLIRTLGSQGSVAKVSYFFEDQGLASHLSKNIIPQSSRILRGIYANLRQELHYRPHPQNEIFSYRTHDGTEVPLVFRFESGWVGFIPSEEKIPTIKALASARSFLKRFPKGKVVITSSSPHAESRDFRTLLIPYWWIS